MSNEDETRAAELDPADWPSSDADMDPGALEHAIEDAELDEPKFGDEGGETESEPDP